MPKKHEDYNVKPLREAGWEYEADGFHEGYWLSPLDGKYYTTAAALLVLEKLEEKKMLDEAKLKALQGRSMEIQPRAIKNLNNSTASSYLNWYEAGIHCYYSNQDCENCWAFKSIGLHKDDGCHQPQVIKVLLRKGIKPPRRQENA